MSAINRDEDNGRYRVRPKGNARRRGSMIVLTMVLAGGIALVVSMFLIAPSYVATSQVTYSQTDADAVSKALEDAGTARLAKTVATDALVLQTTSFAASVSDSLRGSVGTDALLSSVRVSTPADVDVVRITSHASSADVAASIANTYADGFIKARQEEMGRLLQSALDLVQSRTGSLGSTGTGTDVSLQQQQSVLDNLISQAIADYKVLERASAPLKASSPQLWLNLLWGLGAGLVLGWLLTLRMARKRRKPTDGDSQERAVDLPVLGAIPTIPSKRRGGGAVVGFQKGDEALLECMYTVCSNLKALGFGATKRTVLVTTAAHCESKSALAVDLALSMALTGDRVILVDADLRNPTIHRYLGLTNTQGLGEVLADGGADWSEKVQAVELAPFVDSRLMPLGEAGQPKLSVSKFMCLTAGVSPNDPTGLLASSALQTLLGDLRGYSDYVIINGSPLITGSDSVLLAQSVDALVLSTTHRKQPAAEAMQVRQLLVDAETQILGLVICGAKAPNRGGYRL